jgi:hypothetical protein
MSQGNRHAYDLYSDAEWEAVQAKSKPFTQQVKNVFREDPGIPIFLALTCFALGAGMRQSFVVRDATKANNYMFLRVGAQAGAACAVAYSIFRVGTKDEIKSKELQLKLDAEKAQHSAESI